MMVYIERLEKSRWMNTGSFDIEIPEVFLDLLQPIPVGTISEPYRAFAKVNKVRPLAFTNDEIDSKDFDLFYQTFRTIGPHTVRIVVNAITLRRPQ